MASIILSSGFPFGLASLSDGNNGLASGIGTDGYIIGKVTENGVGVSRRVMCYHRHSGALVGTTWSNDDGAYLFDGLIAGVKYYLTAIDGNTDAVQYNAVTQDLVVASEVVL